LTAAPSRRAHARRRGAAALALAWLLGPACGGPDDPATSVLVLAGEDPIAGEVSELRRSLLRDGGVIRSSTPLTRSPHGVKASWEIALAGTWPEYVDWVERRVAPPFVLRQKASHRLVFVRTGYADTYLVTITRLDDRAARIDYAGAPW
jgi:hypothetical protein